MKIKITSYNAICNLGDNIETIYKKALQGDCDCFQLRDDILYNRVVRTGEINGTLKEIGNDDYNLRCNKLTSKVLELLKDKIIEIKNRYSDEKISIVCATTNSGVEEYEKTRNPKHYELGTPAEFVQRKLRLNSYYTTVSTACSSGIKAISHARDLLRAGISDVVIVVCVDSIAKVPLYGFNSLEVLSDKPSIPFGKNRAGMNIGEACAIFILEKNTNFGIDIMGIGESSDIYHSTTPDPEGQEAVNAMVEALAESGLKSGDIDYINAHGTGTVANDIMETNAIFKVFKDTVPVSSTKPMTGHCLGAASGIETALCCALIDNFEGKLFPNVYDDDYDKSLPNIKLVNKDDEYSRCKICMCNSFGFGGVNAILILGKQDG